MAIALLTAACGSKNEPASAGNELQSLTLSKVATQNFIDSINGVADFSHGTATVPRSGSLTVSGWAVDLPAKLPASKVFIDLDGKIYAAQYGIARPDVALVFKEPAFTNSGFTATLPNSAGDGEHRVFVDIVSSAGGTYYSGASATFVLK